MSDTIVYVRTHTHTHTHTHTQSSSRQYEDSWRFAVKECGRIVEQKNELQQKLETLQQVIASNSPHSTEVSADYYMYVESLNHGNVETRVSDNQ